MKTTLVKRALPETAASVHMSVDLIKFTTKKRPLTITEYHRVSFIHFHH